MFLTKRSDDSLAITATQTKDNKGFEMKWKAVAAGTAAEEEDRRRTIIAKGDRGDRHRWPPPSTTCVVP